MPLSCTHAKNKDILLGGIHFYLESTSNHRFASYVHINSKITAMVKIVYDCAIFYMDIDGENLRIFFRNMEKNQSMHQLSNITSFIAKIH